jgi:hypothetical protein
LQAAPDLGSVSYIVETYIEICRLLGRMGQALDEALQQARASTKDCLKPDVYLERLKRIEDGDYYQFEWQRNQ